MEGLTMSESLILAPHEGRHVAPHWHLARDMD